MVWRQPHQSFPAVAADRHTLDAMNERSNIANRALTVTSADRIAAVTTPEAISPAAANTVALTVGDLASVPPVRSGFAFLLVGLLVSTVLHASVLVFLQADNAEPTGSGGVQLDVISVDLVPVTSLRSGPPDQTQTFGTDAVDQDQTNKTEAGPRDVTEPSAREALMKPTDGGSELAAAEIIKPNPVQDDRSADSDKDKSEKPEDLSTSNGKGRAKETREASDAATKGTSAFAATPGQIARYALSVQQTLNRNPPRHLRTRGRAVVEFGLTETGSVRFAQVAKSSGVKKLDDAVLAAISNIRFPAPPGGMTDRQRSFTAPVEFR
jgi:TonB family protein